MAGSGFGTRAENRSASSPKQLLFLPVDPGGLKYSRLLRPWKPHAPGQEQWGSSTAGIVSDMSGSDDITDLCPSEGLETFCPVSGEEDVIQLSHTL